MERNKIETGFSSDAKKEPRRVVFVTKKTSAKVVGDPGPQLMTYPHLLIREAIAFQVLVIAMVLVALLWDAPLEQLANPLLTPNPAKAPWYFLGLQELLHYFPPIVAGVLIPVLVIIALIVIPYFFINIHVEPFAQGGRGRSLWVFAGVAIILLIFFAIYAAWSLFVLTIFIAGLAISGCLTPPGRGPAAEFLRSRTLPWWVMTWFILSSITLTVVGTFFRG